MLDNNRCWPVDYELPVGKKKPRKWPAITPDLHEKIKKLYQHRERRTGEVTAFAEKHGLPRWKITKYAIRQGWIEKTKKEPDWSAREVRVLEQSAHHSPEIIQRHLKRIGSHRSVTAIVLKRKRMRLLSNLNGQSATSLALCLGVEVHFVTRAIKNGQLKATRRQLHMTSAQGGNPFLIKDEHVREFILNNLNLIDLRKVDKYWFVDVLTRGEIN